MMKRSMLWTVLLALLTGCAGSEEPVSTKVPIRLTAGVGQVAVRGPVGDGSEFNAVIYRWDYLAGNMQWMDGKPDEDVRLMKVQAGGSILISGGDRFFYLTDTGGGMYSTTFKAVTPEGRLDGGVVTFDADRMDGTQDVMVTGFVNVGNMDAPVDGRLIFEHGLAQFVFKAVKQGSSEIKSVTGITLKSVSLPQTVNLLSAGEMGYADRTVLPLVMGSGGVTLVTGATVGLGEAVMIKPGAEQIAFDIEAVNDQGEPVSISATALFDAPTEAGKSYLITLDFNQGEVLEEMEVTATIGAWIQSEGGDATFDDV